MKELKELIENHIEYFRPGYILTDRERRKAMKEFKITCKKGITYTDIETFGDEFEANNDSLTDENTDYLDNVVWEYIEETKGEIPDYIVWILYLLEDFFYTYQADRETVEYDLYKGWEWIRVVIQNPKTNNYYQIFKAEGRYGDTDYPEGYQFTQVEPYDKVVNSWRKIGEKE